MSVKQGIKYDSVESAREIPSFIEFHKLHMDEVLDPLSSFSSSCSVTAMKEVLIRLLLVETFNQFFYRCVKPLAYWLISN